MHFLKLHDTKSPFRKQPISLPYPYTGWCLSLLPLFQPSTALPNPQDSHTNPAPAGTHDLISHFQYFLTPNPPTYARLCSSTQAGHLTASRNLRQAVPHSHRNHPYTARISQTSIECL
ncbi:hypothetical protein PSPO01_03904 [Paraphaeosphaeria sporulosa]